MNGEARRLDALSRDPAHRGRPTSRILSRAVLVWFGLLAIAIVNGGIREGWVIPAVGEVAGRAISTVMLSVAILAFAWLTSGWMRAESRRAAATIGTVWVVLTLTFEFVAGHYLFGATWESLLADYDVSHGRIWILVLITTLLAPTLARRRPFVQPRQSGQ
jgi:hypothetical protein